MKLNVSGLSKGNRFQIPSSQWLTVVEVRPVDMPGARGYSEVETVEPFVAKSKEWFTAPSQHRVTVLECVNCVGIPSVGIDSEKPISALGYERGLCQYCLDAAARRLSLEKEDEEFYSQDSNA